MRPQDLPWVGRVLAFGPDDVVYDSLILLGPLVVALFVVAGRNPVTIAVALGYVASFVSYAAYRAVESNAG